MSVPKSTTLNWSSALAVAAGILESEMALVLTLLLWMGAVPSGPDHLKPTTAAAAHARTHRGLTMPAGVAHTHTLTDADTESTDTPRAQCDNYALSGFDHMAKFSPTRQAFVVLDSDGSFNHRIVRITDAVANDSDSAPRGSLLPISGNWFGPSQFDGVGMYDVATATFYLKSNLTDGPADLSFRFGSVDSTARPIAGDWDGSGSTGVGVYYGSTGTVLLRLGSLRADAHAHALSTRNVTYLFGPPGNDWYPVAADWTGNGMASIGLFDRASSVFSLRLANTAGPADITFRYGAPGDGAFPVAGRWAGSGSTAASAGVGIFSSSSFQLKFNLTEGGADLGYAMANPGTEYDAVAGAPSPWLPVVGRWRPLKCRSFGDSTSAEDPPDWMDAAVFYQLRIELFTANGTFDSAIPRLAFVASLGVTAIVLLPVAEARVPGAPVTARTIFYGVRRPDVIDATLGGGAGLARFVTACHNLGMKVVVDNVPNGIRLDSPYLPTSPQFCGGLDVTRRNTSGEHIIAWGSNVELDWTAPELIEWWTQAIGVGWVKAYDIDGFRCDCEPHYGNAPLWIGLAAAIQQRTGKRVLVMAEGTPVWDVPASRSYAFHVSQHDFDSIRFNPALPPIDDFYFGTRTVANAVQSCGEPYATRTLTNHDYSTYVVHGRFSAFVYGAAISPFAPHWFTGEEFNQTRNLLAGGTGVLYFQVQDWDALNDPPRQLLASQVSRAMAVRKVYLHIIRPMAGHPINSTDIAMLPYDVASTDLPPYAMFNRTTHQGVFVLASRDRPTGNVTVTAFPDLSVALAVPPAATLSVTELLSNVTVVDAVQASTLSSRGFTAVVESGGALVFLVGLV
jgi:hypothetical protein